MYERMLATEEWVCSLPHSMETQIVIPAKAGSQLFDLTGFPLSRERQNHTYSALH